MMQGKKVTVERNPDLTLWQLSTAIEVVNPLIVKRTNGRHGQPGRLYPKHPGYRRCHTPLSIDLGSCLFYQTNRKRFYSRSVSVKILSYINPEQPTLPVQENPVMLFMIKYR
jgi:hypothetical protein